MSVRQRKPTSSPQPRLLFFPLHPLPYSPPVCLPHNQLHTGSCSGSRGWGWETCSEVAVVLAHVRPIFICVDTTKETGGREKKISSSAPANASALSPAPSLPSPFQIDLWAAPALSPCLPVCPLGECKGRKKLKMHMGNCTNK